MSYRPSDPLNPPLVLVPIDGEWWPGHVIAQELRDGDWWASVEYSRDGNRRGWFRASELRADDTDYSRGRE